MSKREIKGAMFRDEHCFYLPNETHPREDYLSHRRSAAFLAVRNFFRLSLLSCKHPTRMRERCVRFVRGRVFGFEAGGAGPLPPSLPVARRSAGHVASGPGGFVFALVAHVTGGVASVAVRAREGERRGG